MIEKRMAVLSVLLIITMLGPTTTPAYADTQWQLGWKTNDSDYARGINANVYANWLFLTNSIGLLQGFTDDEGYWINIGIGNDYEDPNSTCEDPPVLWEEVIHPNGTVIAHYSLGCLIYGYTYQLSIVYDSTVSEWSFFYNEGKLTSYGTGGTTIDDTGSVNMIERTNSPGTKDPTYYTTIFTDGLQYTDDTYDGDFPTFNNPSNAPYVHCISAPYYFDTTKSGSAPYQFTFSWSH